tara:strand:- start:152 stop:844 length:693 start_codon:yes stop_codon:yes gene_type:complete
MTPLFKTHFSIGRSILRLNDVERIAKKNNLEYIYFVEDSMTGFPAALKLLGDRMRFGLRLSIFNEDENPESESKIIAFADGDEGCKDLYKLCTQSFDEKIKTPWENFKNLKFAVPFYDSFLHKNLTTFSNCMPRLPKDIHFLLERNDLPFDYLIEQKVRAYVLSNSHLYKEENMKLVKSIYYENKRDIEAFQTYKCICNRQPGRQANLSNPRLDHFGSDSFCIESWEEQK